MKTILERIYVQSGSLWGVWRIPDKRRSVFGVRPVAVFESLAQAKAFALSFEEPNF
jgi:hypothetical protein